jgi:hypothetical protein
LGGWENAPIPIPLPSAGRATPVSAEVPCLSYAAGHCSSQNKVTTILSERNDVVPEIVVWSHSTPAAQHRVMNRSSYDPIELLARSRLWRVEAAAAPFPSMRAFCLSEADRCEQMVQRSFHTPILMEREGEAGLSAPRVVQETIA